MGAGKTSQGQALAKLLGFRFADTDMVIEEMEGMSVQEIFNLKGEEWFRQMEMEVLHKLGGLDENMIISTGGGVPCFNNNMEFINSTGISIYLRMPPAILAKRLKGGQKSTRPLLQGKTNEQLFDYIKLKLREREPFYMLSRHVINAETIKPHDLINIIKST